MSIAPNTNHDPCDVAERVTHTSIPLFAGIGLTIESDFYATDAGRQHFRDQLTSIRYWYASLLFTSLIRPTVSQPRR